jgi:hypothetical protein
MANVALDLIAILRPLSETVEDPIRIVDPGSQIHEKGVQNTRHEFREIILVDISGKEPDRLLGQFLEPNVVELGATKHVVGLRQ